MSDIGPGDFVEAIDSSDGFWVRNPVSAGAVRRVTETAVPAIEPCGVCGDNSPGVRVEGDKPMTPTSCWCRCFWKPIYRPKADLIEDLLTPVLEDA